MYLAIKARTSLHFTKELTATSFFHQKYVFPTRHCPVSPILTGFISDLIIQHQADIKNHAAKKADSSDEESGNACPIFSFFYDQEGSESVEFVTVF